MATGRLKGPSNQYQSTMVLEAEAEPTFELPKAHNPRADLVRTFAPNREKTQTPDQLARARRAQGWVWVDGMQYHEPETLKAEGKCGPNGEAEYSFYTGHQGLGVFLKYLKWIASTNAVFALDFETGPRKTAPVDPTTGEFDLTRLAYSTDPKRYGSDPHTSVVFLASISVMPGKSHVIDVREMLRLRGNEFRRLLGIACTQGRMIAHNAAFEWCFVKALTGVDSEVYMDTMIGTRIAYAGLPDDNTPWVDPRKMPPFLAAEEACLRRELGIQPDKTWQRFFLEMHPDSGFVDEQLAYVAGDTAFLLQLEEIVRKHLVKRKLLHIWEEIERPFLPIVARSHYEGVHVDVSLMIQYRDEAQAEFDELLPRWKALDVQILVKNEETGISKMEEVNYDSVPDLLAYFKHKYPRRTFTNRQGKASVDDDILLDLVETEQDKVAAIVRELRIVTRTLSTYLKPWIETHRNPVTGNIHCEFSQCDTATGRMAARNPNLQNLPSKSKWNKVRHCFVSGPGNMLVDRDLSQFEIRALADMAGEEAMMDFFRQALVVEQSIRALWDLHPEWGIMSEETRKSCEDVQIKTLLAEKKILDFHSLNAAAIFGTAFTQGTEENQTLFRKQGKSLSFGIPYGISATKVAGDFRIGVDAAQALIDKYYNQWRLISKYLDKQKWYAREKSFSFSPTNRLRFYPTRLPSSFSDKERKSLIRSFERQGQNFSVQSINGDVLKKASILMAPILMRYGARIVLWVHDEILVECPEEHVATVASEMERCMIAAAPLCGLHTCPIETSLELGRHWSH